MTGKLVLAIDSLAQLLSAWTSHWVSSPCGGWFLPEWAIQETKAKVARHCHYALASGVTYHHSCYILLVTQENPWFRMGEDYTRAWILGGANHWGPFWRLAATELINQVAIPGTPAPHYMPFIPTKTVYDSFYICISSSQPCRKRESSGRKNRSSVSQLRLIWVKLVMMRKMSRSCVVFCNISAKITLDVYLYWNWTLKGKHMFPNIKKIQLFKQLSLF